MAFFASHQGSLDVSADLSATWRARDSFEDITITAPTAYQANSYTTRWLRVTTSGTDPVLQLPNATSLPVGWWLRVTNLGTSANLLVKTNDLVTTVATVTNDLAFSYEVVLVVNGTQAGVWAAGLDIDAATAIQDKYVANFTPGSFSTSGDESFYSRSISVHKKGTMPVIFIYQTTGSDCEKIYVKNLVNNISQVQLYVQTGDEFAGRMHVI
jgi:hypothetical protein